LVSNGFTALPVLDEDGDLIGIVTRRDLLRVLSRDDQSIASHVRHRRAIHGGPIDGPSPCTTGAVAISDEFDNATNRHVAAVLADAVPGGRPGVRVTGHPAQD
jgi:CBS domain-containing protein